MEGVRASLDSHTGRPTEDSDPHVTLFERERAHIVKILERCRWRIKGRGNAADRLGLAASTLRDRMKKLGISRPR